MKRLSMFCAGVQYIMLKEYTACSDVYCVHSSLNGVPMTVGHKLYNFLPHLIRLHTNLR